LCRVKLTSADDKETKTEREVDVDLFDEWCRRPFVAELVVDERLQAGIGVASVRV